MVSSVGAISITRYNRGTQALYQAREMATTCASHSRRPSIPYKCISDSSSEENSSAQISSSISKDNWRAMAAGHEWVE